MREFLSFGNMWPTVFFIASVTVYWAERSKKSKKLFVAGGSAAFSVLALASIAYAYLSGISAQEIYSFIYHIVPTGVYMAASIAYELAQDEKRKSVIYWIMAVSLTTIMGLMLIDIVEMSKLRALVVSIVFFICWVVVKVRNVSIAEFFADRYEGDECEE